MVNALVQGEVEPDEAPGAQIVVTLKGKALGGAIDTNEETLVPVRSLVEDLKWKIRYANESNIVLDAGDESTRIYLGFSFLDESVQGDEDDSEDEIVGQVVEHGYVPAQKLAEELDLPIDFDEQRTALAIGAKPRRARAGEPRHRQVVVRRGDTLARIPAIHLGNGARWAELLKTDGTPFTHREARRLQVGQVVLVPTIEDEEPIPAAGEIVHEPPADLKSSGVDLDSLVNAAGPRLSPLRRGVDSGHSRRVYCQWRDAARARGVRAGDFGTRVRVRQVDERAVGADCRPAGLRGPAGSR